MRLEQLLPLRIFLTTLSINIFIGSAIIAASLFLGIFGYRYYEGMSWVDAYMNASMILSGMGPATDLKTDAGKIFAGSYALFSGIIFLIAMAIVFAPVFQRVMHKFHLDVSKLSSQK